MSNVQNMESTSAATTTTSAGQRMDMHDAVDSILINPNAPEETKDKQEDSNEVTAAEAAQKSTTEDGFSDAVNAEDDADEVEATAETEEDAESETDEEPQETEASDEQETEDDSEAEAEDEAEVMYTTPEGEEVTLEELKRSYLRQADYTRKTQEVATERQQLEQSHQALEQKQDVMAQHLSLALDVLEPQLSQFAQIDWQSLATNDPYEYAEKQALYQQSQARYQQVMGAAQELSQQAIQQKEAAKRDMLAKERDNLIMALPDMADPTKGRKLASDIKEYAISQGLSPKEASGIVDHRVIVMLNKARQFDEMMNTQVEAGRKKVKKGPRKVVTGGKPQSKNAKQQQSTAKVRQQLAQSGDIDSAVDWLLTK